MKMDPSLHLVSDQTSADEVRGRTADFEELVQAEHVRLFRALALITRDPAEAEDVMQEAFLKVWERWGRAPSPADPSGYLYRTAMNVYRSRRRRGLTALRRAIGLHPGRDELAAVEARNDVVQALGALTPRQRLSVVLIELLDYSSKEAAQLMGIKAATARVLASQGRAALKRELGEHDE
jgi:RNA polymerase sigma-70 factor (ECF subfamily)